jgi:hypothetical protein
MAPKKRRAQSRPPLVKTVQFDGERLDGHALDAMIAESEERLERMRSAKRSLTTNYFEVLPAEIRPLVLAQLLLHAERPAAYARVCTAWLSDWRDKQPLQQDSSSTILPQAGTFLQPCGQSLLLTGCTSTWLSMPTSNTFLVDPAARRFADDRSIADVPFRRFCDRRIQGAAFSSDGSTVYLIDWSNFCVVKLTLQSGGVEYNQVATYTNIGTLQPGPGIALDEAAGQVIVPLRGAGEHKEHVVLLDLDLKVLGRYPHAGVPKKDLFEDGVQTAAVSGGRIAVADSYNHRVQLLRRDPADPARLQLERHVNQGMKRRSEFRGASSSNRTTSSSPPSTRQPSRCTSPRRAHCCSWSIRRPCLPACAGSEAACSPCRTQPTRARTRSFALSLKLDDLHTAHRLALKEASRFRC